MTDLWELYNSSIWIKPFLLISIIIFIITSIILYIVIISSRSKNLKKEKLTAEYDIVIEKLMFSIIFQDLPSITIRKNKNYKTLFNTPFFRESITNSIIILHKNYEGIYAEKIRKFYKESGLIKDSYIKLTDKKWEVKCKGITELSEMNITEAFDTIMPFSRAKNKTLEVIAINACIKLGGVKGLMNLIEYSRPIDDWTQLNIIYSFKQHDLGDTEGIEFLLDSKNTTVVTLGLKLIKELKLSQKIPYVAQLAIKTTDSIIKQEAKNIIHTLQFNIINQ